MKNQRMQRGLTLRNPSLALPMTIASSVLLATLAGCASTSVQRYEYSATTNATDEISRIESELNSARGDQIQALSPRHYEDAVKSLQSAKKEASKGDSNEKALKDLGYARAHLDAAKTSASRVKSALPGVIEARSKALEANADRLTPEDMGKADKEFMKTAKNFEKGNTTVSPKRTEELTRLYSDTELLAIKTQHLSESKTLIENAKKMGANKLAKQTLQSAESKYLAADAVINTDRHNTSSIEAAAQNALTEARRLDTVTRTARLAKNGTPEEIALMVQQEQEAAQRSREQLSSAETRLRSQSATLGAKTAENRRLEAEKRFNEAFTRAQNAFSNDEAEVYRQGDSLLIRLKKMQFTTGRSQLPANSLPVLGKVKDVINTMGAENVVVEGHTDTTGSKAVNMKLSEERAKAIGEYLVSVNAVSDDQVKTEGFGFDKPIASNKTAAGRAQNRRVDVLITPPRDTRDSTRKMDDKRSRE
jgi:OOP family OmpA-OmpF porin